jgi:hypothetical protein
LNTVGLSATIYRPTNEKILMRIFKTSTFDKLSKKAGIDNKTLCLAAAQVIKGQADDLGGGVFKKRLNNNMHRGILLTKTGAYWIFEYLFAKNKRENIDDDELAAFRLLAKSYGNLDDAKVARLINEKYFLEICNEDNTKIQK